MKRVFCLFLLLCYAAPISASVSADVKGSMALKGKSKSSQSFLDLLKCGLLELPKKFLRKEKIDAEYNGGTFLTLEETDANNEKLTLRFRVPSILRVTSTKKMKKEVVKSGTVGVDCLVSGKLDNTGSSGDSFSSAAPNFKKHRLRKRKLSRTKTQRKKNKINNLLRNGSTGLTFSVKRLVAVRKGSKGRLKGTFVRKKDKALGRFSINFKYEDTENSKKI